MTIMRHLISRAIALRSIFFTPTATSLWIHPYTLKYRKDPPPLVTQMGTTMSSSSASTSTSDDKQQQARELMAKFAARTGLTTIGSDGNDKIRSRYLWTDSFAVCTYLGMARHAKSNSEEMKHYEQLATTLVDSVHSVLGQYDPKDSRKGWLDGASEEHPTLGGLRIGKKMLERGGDEPYDRRLEWDRDGQYFHYLTKWMFALDQMARYTAEEKYHLWGCELANAASSKFVYDGRRTPNISNMYWKMSVDLDRPLVPSQGASDPLDGYVSCVRLLQTQPIPSHLNTPLVDWKSTFRKMIRRIHATDDTLG